MDLTKQIESEIGVIRMGITYDTRSVVVIQHPKGNVWQNAGKVQKECRGGHLVYCFVAHKPCKTVT